MNKAILSFACLLTILSLAACHKKDKTSGIPEGKFPNEDYFTQRAYPDAYVDMKAYEAGMMEAKLMAVEKVAGFDDEWTVQGPGNIGARVNTVAVNPQNEDIIFAGFSSGGLWRTTNGGQSWSPVFDEKEWPSIGDIAFSPSDPNTIYVGTGDPNISFYPMLGDGIYRSTDGGDTWTHLGLAEQRVITKIALHPTNPNIIFAASMGNPFVRDDARGLFRSTDAGATWQKVLNISDQAGVSDLIMDPFDPNVLYASGWDRVRNNFESVVRGPGAKVFKTMDGGNTWTQLTNGLPSEENCRTGLAISLQTPGLVYALYVNTDLALGAIFKSTDAGANWDSISIAGAEGAFSNFGWYFAQIRVNPTNDDELYLLGVEAWRGFPELGFWELMGPEWWTYEVHADKHDMEISPSGNFFLATDGGLYRSDDNGIAWSDIENIPTTQLYRVAYNPHEPNNYYGGAQDNGTFGGNTTNINDWPRIYGGDGFQPIFHPTDPLVFYVETQNGGLAVTDDGGNSFYNADDGIDGSDRRNWNMPIIMSTHNPEVLYTGTYRLYRSESGSAVPYWTTISDDLTDTLSTSTINHNISAISESPLEEGLVYVGTADGKVQRCEAQNLNCEEITGSLPVRYVSDVKASPFDANRVYVTHTGYRDNEFIPRIHRSDDRGNTWQDISANLPNIAINDLYVLPGHADSVLFVATDAGVYASKDGAQNWHRLGNNMPFVPSFDLDWNPDENTLIAGTFARSIMTYPLDSLLAEPISATKNQGTATIEMQISPNPASSHISVTSPNLGQAAEVAIFDLRGQQIRTAKNPAGKAIQQRFDIAALPAGQYFARVKSGGKVGIKRFIKT